MVREARKGTSHRAVAKKFRVAKSQVDRWVERAQRKRLDRVDGSDRSPGPKTPHNRSSKELEELAGSLTLECRNKFQIRITNKAGNLPFHIFYNKNQLFNQVNY